MAQIQFGDVATWVTGLGVTGALVFGGLEVRHHNTQVARDKQVELEGVSVSWRAALPRRPDVEGQAIWKYRFVAQNPGRLPITNVRVEMLFGVPVRRIAIDGRIGEPTTVLNLSTSMLAGGAEKEWLRRLRVQYSRRSALKETMARITFRGPDGQIKTNVWSASADSGSPDPE